MYLYINMYIYVTENQGDEECVYDCPEGVALGENRASSVTTDRHSQGLLYPVTSSICTYPYIYIYVYRLRHT